VAARAELPGPVGPYHEPADRPQPLARYAEETGLKVHDPATAEWLRLGTDRGAEICLADDGTVRSVFCAYRYPGGRVNSSLDAWIRSLDALRDTLAELGPQPIGGEAVRIATDLEAVLRRLDPEAVSDPADWWPQVAQDLRLTASVAAAGIIEFRAPGGALRTVRGYTLPGQGHVERRLWESLRSREVEPEQVVRIHTDLEPCMLPGNYCADWLSSTFPDAGSTYSFDYGPRAEDRERGVGELTDYLQESRP